MELNYFISGSETANSSQRDKWLDTSSSTIRSFTQNKSYTITGISGDSDFSLFLTLDKKNKNAGSLLSNLSWPSLKGFSLNFNNNNELFIYSNYNSVPDCYTFSDIRLGQKNCIGIIKTNKQITLLNYDLDARSVYKSESFNFKPTTEISGGNFSIGYSVGPLNSINLSGISGIFDQFVLFDTALNRKNYESIFSGFLPLQGTFVTTYTPYYENKQIETKSNSILSESNASKLIPFLDYIGSSAIPLLSGNYIGNVTGVANAAQNKIYWSGYYSLSENLFCYPTGSLTSISGEYTPYTPVAFNGNLYFNNDINRSVNQTAEIITSHLFSFYTNNAEIEDFFSYNSLQKNKYITTPTLVESVGATDYKKTFYMDGIVSEKVFCNLGFYGTSLNYKNIGIELEFSIAKSLFKIDTNFQNTYNLYWKDALRKSTDYTISNGYIDINNVIENSNYPMIYDMTSSSVSILNSSFSFATGNFPRGAAVSFSGPNAASLNYRQRKNEFYETSTYHINHGKKDKITLVDLSSIYNNTSNYWSSSMRPLVEQEIVL
jgi:hypothetical protein